MNSTNCPEGGDSPLSTTSNVLGILTFAIGLFFFVVAFFKITAGAENEIKKFKKAQIDSAEYVKRAKEAVDELFKGSDPDYQQVKNLIIDSLNAVDGEVKAMGTFLDRPHFKQHISIWSRINWWLALEEVEAFRTQLNSAQQFLTASLLTLNLKYVHKHLSTSIFHAES